MSDTLSNNIDRINRIICNLSEGLRTDANCILGWSANSRVLTKVFAETKSDNIYDIYFRVVLLDSLLSTNLSKRYYGFVDLANAIYGLSKKNNFKQNLIAFANNPPTKQNVKTDSEENNEILSLFGQSFGMSKDGRRKQSAQSLISKYAFYETSGNFPIYDGVTRFAIPFVLEYCGLKNPVGNKESAIVAHIKQINLLKERLCVSYGELDQFLWYLGESMYGRFSLILSKEEYRQNQELFAVYYNNYKECNIKSSEKSNCKQKQSYFSNTKELLNKLTKSNNITRQYCIDIFKLAIEFLESEINRLESEIKQLNS